ncbi:hypothetical protein Ocin01_00701 [Orchesella cincta]|uniref:Uncharacterized protein n=1 Tax=Orchesella cincta TaxID=48709 RepID=A0A1D2NL34_ORCCI|nr:hypothetical protein Ocin01_00701 [Orchesella cincta]
MDKSAFGRNGAMNNTMILPVFLIGSALFFAAVNYAFERFIEDGKENSFDNPLQCLPLPTEEYAEGEAALDDMLILEINHNSIKLNMSDVEPEGIGGFEI